MAKLKTHPRDEEANRFVLLRAERLFKELPAELRKALSGLLDGFEAALGMQDAAAIAGQREELERFLSLYDRHADDPNGSEA
jgi:molecular chaperone HscC